MRIEYEGAIEVQPAYQHVGYISACVDSYVSTTQRPYSSLLLGMALLFVVLSVLTARRMQGSRCWVLVTLAAVAAIVAGGAGVWALKNPVKRPYTEFYVTVYRLEKLSADTEAWAEHHGRLPNADEWQAMHDPAELLDGWGHPFEYTIHPDEPGFDGQFFAVTSLGIHRGKNGSDIWDIPSWILGGDGVFGTSDDRPDFREMFYGFTLDPAIFPHGRSPREVK